MFARDVYIQRRKVLRNRVGSGLILFLGNEESPMNYPANPFPFRQDSSFLYYWGLDFPGLAAVLDVDSGTETLFGTDFTVDDIIWMGPQKTLAEKAGEVGVGAARPTNDLKTCLNEAVNQGRKIHYLAPYRSENLIKIEDLTGIPLIQVCEKASEDLIRAVVAQRSIKSEDEVREIEKALDISHDMYTLAMKMSRPGLIEHDVYGAVEGVVLARGSHVSFPVIFSIHGETLHNHHHHNEMKDGDLLVLDSGAESPLHYASDITRTFPVSGTFSPEQKDLYNVVLEGQTEAIAMMKPGVLNRDVHLHTARVMAEGLKALGFIKGDMNDAVAAGAHALFFPHGLGHMIGLDVHDMEDLGEQYVGYDETVERSDQFGLAYLRLARKLQTGFVVTVEPGIYFIPALMDQWKSQNKFADFINYDKVLAFKNFGGIRIEDDVLVTGDGSRVLGKPIARTVDEVEAWCAV